MCCAGEERGYALTTLSLFLQYLGWTNFLSRQRPHFFSFSPLKLEFSLSYLTTFGFVKMSFCLGGQFHKSWKLIFFCTFKGNAKLFCIKNRLKSWKFFFCNMLNFQFLRNQPLESNFKQAWANPGNYL